MNLKAAAVFLAFILIYSSIHLYFAWITVQIVPVPFWLASLLFILFGFSYFGAGKVPALKTVGSLWLACFTILLVIFPLLHAAYLLLGLTAINEDMLLTILTVLGVVLFVLYWAFGLYGAYQPVTRSYTVKLNNLQRPFNFVLASDMHFGGLSGTKHVKRLVKKVNRYHADVILLCGDIVDDHPEIFEAKGQHLLLSQLEASKGIFAVTGNHEYYGKQIPALETILTGIGITLLQDESAYISDIGTIIGRKDKTDKYRKTAAELTAAAKGPIIMMDHQPSSLREIAAAGADISVSGHTHRGQIWPFHLITRRMFPLDWGMKQFDQLSAIVSSGFGFWGPPIRLGSRSEIVHVQVKQK